ncbi:MFS transporter [Microlunatus elymi]|uniref:MFS transporter n=1 Tax=Microlunatus elymi TaxID=2596828 RepID=UPI001D1975A1|nr:MFS transporter [Microlunatus elymi]
MSKTAAEPTAAVPVAWPGYARGSSGYRRILIALGAAGVATFAQLYAPQGILPLIGGSLQVDAARSAMTVSAGTFGLAISVLGWSWLADRIGRAPAMKIALAAAAVLGLLTVLAPNFEAMLGLRIAEGVALGGVPALAIAYLHEEVEPGQVAIAAGTYISGTTVGGLLGRLVAAPFADWGGWRIGMLSVAVMAGIASVLFILLIPAARGFRPTGASGRQVTAGLRANLKNPAMLVLYAQAFLLMGGFVAIYNYLGYRLEAAPFGLPVSLAALIFLAYLAGTVSSRIAGGLAARRGRRPVLLISTVIMIIGVALTLPDWLPTILIGLVILTAGFFGAHSIAAGWVGARARTGKAQATSLYNLFYYGGSSLFGWLGGVAYLVGWFGTASMVLLLAAAALLIAVVGARD